MSPKQLWQLDTKRAADHAKTVKEPRMVEALLAAFNEYSWNLPQATHPNDSWAANARRQGAKEFIETFLTLGDPARERKPSKLGKLEDEHGNRDSTLE